MAAALAVALPAFAQPGPGSIGWTAQPNLGPARSAIISVMGADGRTAATATVTQASGCGWLLTPHAATFTFSGGQGAVMVVATDPACPAWAAKSNASWITTQAGPSTVSYAVAKQGGNAKARSGTITIAGQLFTVTQAGKR